LCDGPAVAFCAKQFAQWGADVVVLEAASGSPRRDAGPKSGSDSLQWLYLSANKRGHRLDPSAVGLLLDADVFLTDWPSSRLAGAGIDLTALKASNPALVALVLADFGEGPYAALQGSDLILQALTGYMWVNGEPEMPPLKAPASIVPYAVGLSCYVGALAALWSRARTGVARTVEVAAIEAVASLVCLYTDTAYGGRLAQRRGGIGPPMLPCADGFISCAYGVDRGREAIAVALGLEHSSLPPLEDLHDFLAERTVTWKCQELASALSELGAQCSVVNSLSDVVANSHLQEREFFEWVDFKGLPLKMPRPPVHMEGAQDFRDFRLFDGWAVQRQVPKEKPEATAKRPLEGVRVLDLTQAWLGPYATWLLGILGAEIVKIESPSRPDVWRGSLAPPPAAREGAHPWNVCATFNSVNHGKRSLGLRLDTPHGKEALLRLVEDSDLLLENFTPRVMENFGLGFEVLTQTNEKLVMVSMSGYGQSGPYRDYRATGASVEPVAGWTALFGYPGGRPMTMGFYPLDPIAGLYMAATALTGLLGSLATGRGVRAEGSMFEVAAACIGEELLAAQVGGSDTPPKGNRHRDMAPHGVFRCLGDDAWIAIAVRDDGVWSSLVDVLDEPRLRDGRLGKAAYRKLRESELEEAIASWAGARDPGQAVAALQAAGIPAVVAKSPGAALEDEHLRSRHWFFELTHQDLGTHRYIGAPWRFSGCDLVCDLPPPRLGEHSREILVSRLRLPEREIQALERNGVVGRVLDLRDAEAPVPRRRRA
jgi:crotonobetainyl-CoA:carnitine CoA-transferase CaiB-like acyl-CoA transferase